MLIGTAGHIDHGKTTLVRALTGVDTTHLPEERTRGITIELGYAYAPIPGAALGDADSGPMLAFIDVPGHEKFVPTMLTGAVGIDFALLVVAADDGVMPQTREHLAILQILGVGRGAVAITKCDRVEAGRSAEVEREVRALLAPTPLAGAPVFAVSATGGDAYQLEDLRAHLHEQVRSEPAPATLPGAGFRLAVDRHFAVAGAGTVITGTAHAGRVKVGDRLLLARGDGFTREVRVRGLRVSNRPSDEGYAGQRCAVNLAGIEYRDVERGDWLCAPGLARPNPAERLGALLAAAPLGVDSAELSAAHNLEADAWLACLPEGDPVCAAVRVATPRGQHLFDAALWQALGDKVLARLESHHDQFPDEPGVERERLRRMCVPQLPAAVFLARLESLLAEGRVARAGAAWHLPAHRVELEPADRARADELVRRLADGTFDPPWVRDLAAACDQSDADVRRLLRRIASCGEVFQVVRDLFYPAATVADLVRRVDAIAAVSDGGRVRAAALRDDIGGGRKRAIQILEFFDRVGFTRRVGEGPERAHIIRGEPPVRCE